MSIPTAEQQKVLREEGSCVVVARPGSGKTFTLSHKIKSILEEVPDYKGVIAISYTNKASNEIKNRVIGLGVHKKASFFGTIDKFCLTEIVIPFLSHKFNFSPSDLKIVKSDESQHIKNQNIDLASELTWPVVENLYRSGEIILELSGRISMMLLTENRILKEYLLARFSHIIIDEYQDSGFEQHQIFCFLCKLGIKGIAVGDLDQSIYGFAGKSSDYLLELTDNENFKTYALTKNHRCHPSISAYSLKLLSPNIEVDIPDEVRIYSTLIQGHLPQIANWVEKAISSLQNKFENLKVGEIAILGRSNNSIKAIQKSTQVYKTQLREDTDLDRIGTSLSQFFSECLFCYFDQNESYNNLLEKYVDVSLAKYKLRKNLSAIIALKEQYHSSRKIEEFELVSALYSLGQQIFPNIDRQLEEKALNEVLSDKELLKSYYPSSDDSIQLMTLHKSKGLEFRVVFHIDLYEWTIPSYQALLGDTEEIKKREMRQSINLHYVGITRAIDACVLISSTQKYDFKKSLVKSSTISSFLSREDLKSLRKHL
ncbi:UvrD-helicase domain-containing protein [Halobacteriovorax sp. YZS-1-2]|uniref:UvrD-helicase domain-containing protein n=1 Tax=Halobacteriovorax sp. YZS-1-2 TaxID=3391177 RepID=UPI00399C21B0